MLYEHISLSKTEWNLSYIALEVGFSDWIGLELIPYFFNNEFSELISNNFLSLVIRDYPWLGVPGYPPSLN